MLYMQTLKTVAVPIEIFWNIEARNFSKIKPKNTTVYIHIANE